MTALELAALFGANQKQLFYLLLARLKLVSYVLHFCVKFRLQKRQWKG